MAEVADITRTVPPRTEMRTTIQWGNIIKGAAIVAAVVVVGVVAFNFAVPFITNTPLLSGIIGGVSEGVVLAGQALWGLAQTIGTLIGNAVWPMIPGTMQTAITQGTIAGGAATAGQVGGWVIGGGAALATAIFLKAPQNLWHALTNLVGQERVAVAAKTEVIHQGHNLQDHYAPAVTRQAERPALPAPVTETSTNPPAITDGSGTPSTSGRSSSTWAERVPQASRRDVTPRAESFGEQIQQEQSLAPLTEAVR